MINHSADLLDAAARIMLNSHFDAQAWLLAYNCCDEILRGEPNNADALYKRALCLWHLGHKDRACIELRALISKAEVPAYAATVLHQDALIHLAKQYIDLKAWDSAIAVLTKIIQLNPTIIHSKGYRADCYMAKEDWPRAIVDLTDYIAVHPDEPRPYSLRAFAYDRLKKWELASADSLKAIALSTKVNAYVHFQTAGNLANLGLLDKAIEHAETAISQSKEMPIYADAMILKGRILLKLGRCAESVDSIQQGIHLHEQADVTNVPELYYEYLAHSLIQAQRFKAAVVALSKVIKRGTKCANAYHWRGYCLQRIPNYKRAALKDLNEAIRLNPENSGFYLTRGHCRLQLKDLTGAMADLNRSLDLNEPSPAVYIHRAGVFTLQGDHWSALADYNRLLEFDPNEPQLPDQAFLYEARSRCYRCLGDMDNARADRREASRIRRARNRPNND